MPARAKSPSTARRFPRAERAHPAYRFRERLLNFPGNASRADHAAFSITIGDFGMNEAGTPYGGYTVLVVDDSSTMRRLMDITLGQVGIHVEFADCGNDALALVQQRHYDMVFLDVILPDVDGYRVCKTIKGNKVTRSTPVVMLTSRDTAFDKVRGKMSGADTYLTKPLDRAVLMNAINKHLVAGGAAAGRTNAR